MAVPASASVAAENEKIAFVTTASKEADFESKCKGVVLKTTADVYIAFDRAANSDDFVLQSTDGAIWFPVEFTRVSALGVSGSGTLYIIALR